MYYVKEHERQLTQTSEYDTDITPTHRMYISLSNEGALKLNSADGDHGLMMDICRRGFNLSLSSPTTSSTHIAGSGELELMLEESIFNRPSPV